MNKNGTVEFIYFQGREINQLYWYVTLLNNEITLFSKDFYLFYDEKNEIVKGYQFMIRWKFEKYDSNYLLYFGNKNNILTVDGSRAVISGNNNNKSDKLYQFIDII